MTKSTKQTCSCCGEVFEEWPALVFSSPSLYHSLSEKMKQQIAELSSDYCIIRHIVQTFRFIRGTLTIKVADHCKSLEYSVWVWVSEQNFQDYFKNLDNPNHEEIYYGWLGNELPGYKQIDHIPMMVVIRRNKLRPEIIPDEGNNHPLLYDYYNGITKAEAEKRINDTLKIIAERVRMKR